MSEEKKGAVVLPEFIRVLVQMAEGNDFAEGGPDEPIVEDEKIIGEMNLWQKACYVRMNSLRKQASEAVEMGVEMESEEVQAFLREAEAVKNIFGISVREGMENNSPAVIGMRQDWMLVDADTCDCPACQARRAGIDLPGDVEGIMVVEIGMGGRSRRPEGLLSRFLGR